MLQRTCMRCGQMFLKPEPGIAASISKVLDFGLGIHRNMFGEPIPELDLCQSCKESLRQWYLSGKENFNASGDSSEACADN